jgi:predicted protein tyrosine phosphatase
VRHILGIHPVARPNRRMLELADAVLNNGGALAAAMNVAKQ